MEKRIICIGGATLDIKCLTQEPVQLGTSNPVSTTRTYGGVARNVAENLIYLSQKIELITVVGQDEIGHNILTYMHNLGVKVDRCLMLPSARTSQYFAIVEPGGTCHASFADMACYEHVNLSLLSDTLDTLNRDCLVFLDTNLPQSIILSMMERQQRQQFELFIDPVSCAKSKKLPHDLSAVFVLKPNQAEASILTGKPVQSISEAILAGNQLLERGVQHVVISLADKGVLLINQSNHIVLPAQPVDRIVDVNGAGDAFCAGMLYGLQHHLAMADACQLGLKAASLTLQTTNTVTNEIAHYLRADNFSYQELTHAIIL